MLLDDGVWPEGGHKGRFLDQPPLALDQVDQQVESLLPRGLVIQVEPCYKQFLARIRS